MEKEDIKSLLKKLGELKCQDFKSGTQNNKYQIEKISALIKCLGGKNEKEWKTFRIKR